MQTNIKQITPNANPASSDELVYIVSAKKGDSTKSIELNDAVKDEIAIGAVYNIDQ